MTYKLGDDEILEIEHINNIYEKKGFKGVIKYAESKLEKYGTVKKIEDGLFKLTTGGWSEHEQWIGCLNNVKCNMGRRHYTGYIRGGAFYYAIDPYARVEMRLKKD